MGTPKPELSLSLFAIDALDNPEAIIATFEKIVGRKATPEEIKEVQELYALEHPPTKDFP